jgi:hypothetical protein
VYVKTFNSVTNLWICLPDTTKQIDNVTGEVVTIEIPPKGIIVPVIIPFAVSYVAAGIFVIVGLGFMFGQICGAKRGIFFPFVTGMLALPETVAIGGCFFYHLMYNYYESFDRTNLST